MACQSISTPLPHQQSTNAPLYNDFRNLEIEYAAFTTQALTQNYLERKIHHWLDTNNGAAMVREIEFARYKHPELLLQIMDADDVLCESSLAVTEVQSYRGIHPAFSEYLQGFACVHSGEFNVSSENSQEFHRDAAVAMNPDGQFLVVWRSQQKESAIYRIQAQRFLANGPPLAPAFDVGQITTSYQYYGDVAFFDDGSFIIIWCLSEHIPSDLQGGFNVYAQRYFANGTANGPAFRANLHTDGNQYAPAVATSANGNFVIVWQDQKLEGSQDGIYGRLYTSNGSPSGPVMHINTITTGIQTQADVAMSDDGRFTVTWTTMPGSQLDTPRIVAQQFLADGTKSGNEFQVNTHDINEQNSPALAMSGDGRFVIAWNSKEQDGDKGGIFAQRFQANGSPLNGELPINALTLHEQSNPSIVLSEDQRFLVTWQSDLHDGSGLGIYTRAFDAQNQPATAQEIRVNTSIANHQNLPAIASNGSQAVMVWQSQHSNGGDYSIFGQRFDWLSNGLTPK